MRNWITHRVNPVHIYCRLVDFGLGRESARKISAWLEKILIVKRINAHGIMAAGYQA